MITLYRRIEMKKKRETKEEEKLYIVFFKLSHLQCNKSYLYNTLRLQGDI